jgi:hypothetical protein
MNTSYVMSDDMALGLFDADGGIIMGADKKETVNPSIAFKVTYFLGQSLSKRDAVEKFADKFCATTLVDEQDVEFRVNQSSPEGQRFREFLLKNKPKNPYRLRDYYISEEIIPLLEQKTQQSKVGQITLVRLVSNKSRLQKQDSGGELIFSNMCSYINATDAEIQQGSAIADAILAKIEEKLEAYKQSETKLSDDYVLGVHYGDGSLYVSLTWKPTEKIQRLRCEPEWAISGDNEAFCQLFENQFDGTTKPVDNKGQRKFALTGINKCLKILPFFENASWMPEYKKEQFSRWKKSILLLKAQKHFTEEGIRELLDLTYGLAEKGARIYTKDQYLEWGLAWVNDPSRQKRQPRG